MEYKNLRALLGNDFQNLSNDELKNRIGARTRDFNPPKVISPASNEVYKDVVNANVANYYNNRVDALQNAYNKDVYGDLDTKSLYKELTKNMKNPPKYTEKDIPGFMGVYEPQNHELIINPSTSLDQQKSTLSHELRHAEQQPYAETTASIQEALIPGLSEKMLLEEISDPDKAEEALLNNDFTKISEMYNRGHFFGNDQVESIADKTYNPDTFTKLKKLLSK